MFLFDDVIMLSSPFERTATDNEELYSHLKHIPCLANQVPANVLKELCVVAYMDQWKEPHVTGNCDVTVLMVWYF